MQPVRLWDQVGADARVVVLILFGGAAAAVPEGAFRGPLWCQDSFDDLSIQRALIHRFGERHDVRFLAVAVPPVFAPAHYGFPEGAFSLTSGPVPPSDREPLRQFIDGTLRQQRASLLPYPQIFFDPYLALLRRPQGGQDAPWQGSLKWPRDPRKYGVPTIWVLSGSGRVLCEPFWGNEYAATPPQIRYGFSDLEAAVERGLEASP
ncbi:MAG: hypothetical protein WAO20_16630 [Acidobacteriota bacterium]